MNPRAHIGYLVGYITTTNLYKIWIPSLNQVITTHNVCSDEELFYKKELEEQEAIPMGISQELTEQLYTPENVAVKSYIADILKAWDQQGVQPPLTSELVKYDQQYLDFLDGQLGSQDSGVGKLTQEEREGDL